MGKSALVRIIIGILLVLMVLPEAWALPSGSGSPAIPETPDATVWFVTTLDSAGTVGEYTSIAVELGSGIPFIAYYDGTNGDLKVAWRDWTSWAWQTQTVDSTGDVGRYPSVCLYGNTLYVAYYDVTNGNLKLAKRPAYGGWYFWTLDSAGDVGQWTSCTFGESDTLLLIAYYDVTNGNLKSARFDTISETWSTETVDSSSNDVGQYTSIGANLGATRRAISYYDATNGDLKVVRYDSGAWLTPEIVDSAGVVGLYTDIDNMSLSSFVDVTYYDQTNGNLKRAYSTWGGGWTILTLESTNDIGMYNSGGTSLGGNSYYDSTNRNLRFRSIDGTFTNIDTAGDVGRWTSLTRRWSASPYPIHISYYDLTNTALKYAYQCTQPVTSFTHSPEPVCVNGTVTFNNTTTGSMPFTWAWAFGDGGTSAAKNPTHAYASKGRYTASLQATNECGTQSANQTVTVYDKPIPNFTISPNPGCAGDMIEFTDASSYSGTVTYLWDFGDGITSTLRNPSHSYADPGTYNVTLRVTNLCGYNQTTQQAVVDMAPAASFTHSPASLCVGSTVQFTNTTQVSGTTSYLWDFGDGGTSNQPNPSHTYTAAGPYIVTLVALNHCGNDTAQDGLFVNDPPANSSFSWSPVPAVVFEPTVFTGTTSSTLPVVFSWDFGDGGSGTGQVVSHTYTAAGSYTVTLAVQSECGEEIAEISVEVCDPNFQAGISWTPALPVQNEPITFTRVISGGSAPFTYMWEFGDGWTGAGPTVTHSYTGGGWYTVLLTATNDCGQARADAQVFVCVPAVVAGFSWSPPTPTMGGLTRFSAEVGGNPPPACTWDFGDGTMNGFECDITHTYALTGTFTVVVTATNACGAATSTHSVPVVALPAAGFTTNSPVCYARTMVFTNTSTGTEPLAFLWAFGDGRTSTLRNPTHAYDTSGTFTVALTASNPYGVSATTNTVQVRDGVTTADFAWEPARPAPGAAVTLTATDNGTEPVIYEWNLGDGVTATGRVVVHTYAVTGTYTVTLHAYNDCGGRIIEHAVDVAFCTAPAGLSAAYTPMQPFAGATVQFTATLAAGSEPLVVAWDFGDGAPWGYGATITHTYAAQGVYTASVAAWNLCGYAGPANLRVEVLYSGFVYLPLVFKNHCADLFEPDNSSLLARPLILGVPQTHNFAVEGDEDWTRLDLIAGRTYRFWTYNLTGSADTRLYLYLHGDYGSAVASNDDWAAGNCGGTPPDPKQSCFEYTPNASGLYDLRINQYTGGATWGCAVGYTLTATQH